MFDNEDLERISITKLTDLLNRSPRLVGDFKREDKTPCWDGEIRLYKNTPKTNANYIGPIRVQVKSHWVKEPEKLDKEKVAELLRLEDLRKYEGDGGVLYFVALIHDHDRYRFYYAALLPYDLKKLLKQSAQKSRGGKKSVTMKALPREYEKIEEICWNFRLNRKMQFGTVEASPTLRAGQPGLTNFERYSSAFVEVRRREENETPWPGFFGKELYLYGDLAGGKIKVPLQKVIVETLQVPHAPLTVKVNGEEFFDRVDLEVLAGGYRFRFGGCFTADTVQKKLSYQLRGGLNQRIRSARCVLAMGGACRLEIGGSLFEFNGFSQKQIREVSKFLEGMERMERMLAYYGVKEELNYDLLLEEKTGRMKERERAFLQVLDLAWQNEGVIKLEQKELPFLVRKNLGNLALCLAMERLSELGERTYRISSAFADKKWDCRVEREDIGRVAISPYLLIDRSGYAELSNIDYDVLEKDLLSVEPAEYYLDRLNLTLLDMLGAYDQKPRPELLTVCESVGRHLVRQRGRPEEELNYFQCLARKGSLPAGARERLYRLRRETEQRAGEGEEKGSPGTGVPWAALQLGIAILLGNGRDCEYYYGLLSPEEQEGFRQFPIWRLREGE